MFWWDYLGEQELAMGKSQPFESQEAAEAWLAEEWKGLLERGIVEVLLAEEDGDVDVCVYRMGLGQEPS